MKECSVCREHKSLEEFEKHYSNSDGLRSLCRACRKKQNRKWALANKDKIAKNTRTYKERHRELVKERRRAYYAKNREKVRATMNAYVEKNREKIRARVRKWQLDNKEKYLAIMRMVNASRRFYDVRKAHKPEIAKQLMFAQDSKCAACLCDISSKYQIDHIMPAKHGGTNDMSNLQLLCVGCNIRKRDKHPLSFLKERGLSAWQA